MDRIRDIISVYDMPRYPGMDHSIPALGTLLSCLPLFLGGASVGSKHGMTIELGPYFGLSSKCILAGMDTSGVRRENAYIPFDTFEGSQNFKSIQKSRKHAWIMRSYPLYTANNSSFLFLWEKATQPIYPTAQGRPGWISASTLNLQTIGLGSIDSSSSSSSKGVHWT
jgi:hypothetical protein